MSEAQRSHPTSPALPLEHPRAQQQHSNIAPSCRPIDSRERACAHT